MLDEGRSRITTRFPPRQMRPRGKDMKRCPCAGFSSRWPGGICATLRRTDGMPGFVEGEHGMAAHASQEIKLCSRIRHASPAFRSTRFERR